MKREDVEALIRELEAAIRARWSPVDVDNLEIDHHWSREIDRLKGEILNACTILITAYGCCGDESPWIACKDRMPPDNEKVLVITAGDERFGREFGIEERYTGAEGNKFWGGDYWTPISHWMPLPDPPAQAKQPDLRCPPLNSTHFVNGYNVKFTGVKIQPVAGTTLVQNANLFPAGSLTVINPSPASPHGHFLKPDHFDPLP